MSKKLSILISILAFFASAKAQEYQSFFASDSTRLSVYIEGFDWGSTAGIKFSPENTAIFSDKEYYFSTNIGYWDGNYYEPIETIYLREETTTGRLYRYYEGCDTEVLICDMSLNVGDEFVIEYCYSYNGGIDTIGVHHVTSVYYEDGRKVINLDYDLTFREGLFPNKYPIGILAEEYYERLLCVHHNGELVFENPWFIDDNCYINWWGIKESSEENLFQVHPNPVQKGEPITIMTEETIESIQLADMFGKDVPVVFEKASDTQFNVWTNASASGIYVLRVKTEKGVYFEKVIINN